ncbi:type IA DNA topoisomerase [Clostridium disporicum]|uniref:type IA DNA topoisomerase n=1 Tax=Clostridium disporicum TaxID=84024 RepID=UPI0034A489EE
MAKALLIAEKPSLMRDILAVYNKMKMDDIIDFMAFAGHTMTLAEPGDYKAEWGEKKWSWDMLPIVPDNFKCKVSPDKVKLYKELKYKLDTGKYDYVINACDPDREGQAIFQYFYEHTGCKLPVKRFWTNDLTEVSIEKTLLNLRDNNEPFLKNLMIASKLRGQFDWLVGMNLTVASSLQMHTTSKVGRVKTPTLKIIVDRELEILNFKPKTTYELEATFGDYSGVHFDTEGVVRFNTKEDGEKIIKDLSKEGIVESIEKKTESTTAPQLYSLSSLQTDASKTFGYTAEETKSLVQSLYEKKILSYPRTDNPYISSELAKKFPMLLKATTAIPELESYANDIIANKKVQEAVAKNKKYVDDAKMAESGHYAIVPTGVVPHLSKLSKDELNIFTMVSKRLVAIFMPPMKVSKTTIVTNSNGYLFRTTGKILIDKGFSVIFDTKTSDVLLPDVKKGDKFPLTKTALNEKISTPPSRYTDGTLISVMENPIKFLLDEGLKTTIKENKGIGTTATRDNIIGELVANGYIEKKKGRGKVEYIYATEKGISIIENLKDKEISSVDLTGVWEDNLSKVEKGDMNANEFKKLMVDYVLKSIDDIKNSSMSKVSNNSNAEVLGACPKCGKPFKEGKDFYLCSGYKATCDVILPKTFMGAKISKAEMKKILNGKETKELKFSKKDGTETKEWTAKLMYDSNLGKIAFAKNNSAKTNSEMNCSCPKCGKNIKSTEKFFMCSDYKSSCDFILGKEIKGAKITDSDFKKLLKGNAIEKEFTWSSGKTGKAKLKLLNGKLEFDFSN